MSERASHVVELDVQGMTCASCAARIERKLNRLPGVVASVNYATERATVQAGPETSACALIAVVERTGYAPPLPPPPPPADQPETDERSRRLGRRALLAVLLGAPVVLT